MVNQALSHINHLDCRIGLLVEHEILVGCLYTLFEIAHTVFATRAVVVVEFHAFDDAGFLANENTDFMVTL